MKPTFFKTPQAFRAWLKAHSASATELEVSFYKKGTAKPSITWPEAVAEALCVGWIDGVRHAIDDQAYRIRFTPRRPGSTWSAVNIKMPEHLIAAGRMTPAGQAAYDARRENRVGTYAYEQRSVDLPAEYARQLKAHRAAWADWQARAPSYRKAVVWWVVSAKTEATRQKRLAQLIADSAAGRTVPPLTRR